MSGMLILDPELAEEIREGREARKLDRWDEVWEGVQIVAAVPNIEHQRLVMRLSGPLSSVVDWDAGEQVLPGANVSDREKGWRKNYRIPDVLVFLKGNPARNCDTHWRGGPDFAIEIVSPGDQPRKKLDFYASVGTRELLVVDRDPWSLELYHLKKGKLQSVGRSAPPESEELASKVVPMAFRLQKGKKRPIIQMVHTQTSQTWTA